MPKQTYGNDCGAYAIANLLSILHGIDPRSVRYNVSVMWRHIQQGLENKKITVFPHRKIFCKNKPVLKVTGIPIFVHVACQSMASCLHVQNVKDGSILAVNLSTKLNAKFDRQK